MSDNAPTATAPRIAVLATLDTKGAEARFLVAELAARGMRAPPRRHRPRRANRPHDADISRADLARRGATDAVGDDRTTAMTTTADAAASVLRDLLAEGDLDGVDRHRRRHRRMDGAARARRPAVRVSEGRRHDRRQGIRRARHRLPPERRRRGGAERSPADGAAQRRGDGRRAHRAGIRPTTTRSRRAPRSR